MHRNKADRYAGVDHLMKALSPWLEGTKQHLKALELLKVKNLLLG